MAQARRNPERKAKVRRYGAKDAEYQRKLKQYKLEKELGYPEPKYPPKGGNQDRERKRARRRF